MTAPSSRSRTLLICALLALATLAAYAPIRHNEFINLDDNVYVTENKYVRQGLTSETIAWAFTTDASANWHPLTWLSHMLDVELFDLDPAGHHATNVVLHIASSLLLFFVLGRLTASPWASAFVAAVFALHPLHVESVAWAAERKDVLSTLFWMLTLGAYARYVDRPGAMRFVPVFGALALGLMAKPMLVTLPFVLLLLDYWPLDRLRAGRAPARLVVEKLPLFALVIASSAVTFIVQRGGGATVDVPVGLRLANALVSCAGYIVKTVWPSGLAVMYPYPADSIPLWRTLGAAAILALITAGAVWLGRSRSYLAVGWLWYVGTLVPVVGFVPVGYQASADRYTYIPMIGLTIMLAFGVADLVSRAGRRAVWLALPVGVLAVAMILGTRAQVARWKNSFALYEHALAVTEDNYVVLGNLGVAYGNQGDRKRAISLLEQSLRANPDFDHGHYNLAVFLRGEGRILEAIRHYKRAVDIAPEFARAQFELAEVYQQRGRPGDAIRHFRLGLEAQPRHERARLSLAMILHRQGRLHEAIEQYTTLLEYEPGLAAVHGMLARALESAGRIDEAAHHFAEARRLGGAAD